MPKKINLNTGNNAGRIVSFFSGVAKIEGLKSVFLHEALLDGKNAPVAIVIGFDERCVEALFFDEYFDMAEPVFRSARPFSIPVSDMHIGRIVNGLGAPLDGLGKPSGKSMPIFQEAPGIIDRDPVAVPLSTGIKIIDAGLPLGRGQRELIIGDRKLGKSTIARDVVLNQKDAAPPVYCVYVLCGQKGRKLDRTISLFQERSAFLYAMIVAANADSSFAEQYLAPFVGCTIAEYFRNNGKDALIVYDDLSAHAKVYRDISLLLERAPGREAYPGDIFTLHAGLLERAANLSKKRGGGSLTALPIVETQEGDITSFISTNLISITDGQIYVEQGLFQKNFLPAVNIGLSVSRIGSQAQPRALKEVAAGMRLALAQHKELQKLARLETAVSADAQKKIHRGDILRELLKQEEHVNIEWPEQVVLFYAVGAGFFDDISKDAWGDLENLLLKLARSSYADMLEKIRGGVFDAAVKARIGDLVKDFKREFL